METSNFALFDAVSAVVVVLDRDGRIAYWNDAASELSGYSLDEVRGRHVWDFLLAEDEVEPVKATFAQLRASELPSAFENHWVTRSGERRWIAWSNSVDYAANGEVEHIIATGVDQTDRKRAQDALRDAVHSRDRVLGLVAHDLRGPVNSVVLQTKLLERRAEHDAIRTPTARIRDDARRMARLIDDLLDISRIESGRFAVEPTTVRPHELAEIAIDVHQSLASASDVELCHEVPPALPEVRADSHRTMQILDNLVGNALKFTPAGGRVELRGQQRPGDVVLQVADTGPGIPQEHHPRLFEPFWQCDAGDRRGAGLGLAICRGIVEAQRGRIWVESEPGDGATFCFTLPRADAAG